ncbi:MAG: adenylate/guanylate cyclase domain-containing protein [Candidatus Limnocylindrales bacterium]
MSASVERRVVAVLFADLVGFTPLSERLDAEDVAAIQDAYFAAVRETIGRYDGRLEKFIGDAAMAVFGLPRGREDDTERAVRAGLALVGAVERLGAQLGLEDGSLRLRVGIESGEVVAAEGGPDEGRVTGDTVNTAARLQAVAPPGAVLLGEGAALAAASAVELDNQPPIALKGKARPVRGALARAMRAEPSRAAAMGALVGPLVGRQVELGILQAALDDAVSGGTIACLIIAAPGTGKSRLVADFLGELAAPVWRTRVRADSGASLEPLAALASAATAATTPMAIRSRMRASGIDPARAAVLAAEIAGLASSTGPIGDGGGDGGADRGARHGAWIEAFDALAGSAVVWLLEDLHWAGGDLLAFVDRATRTAAAHGRLVIATSRPGIFARLNDWTVDDSASRREVLELPALEREGAAELVRRLVGDILPADLVSTIADRSDGNPLFIEELLRGWVGAGRLVREGTAWRLADATQPIGLPTTVQAIYAAQLDDLPGAERLLVRRATVAGRRFPIAALEPLAVPDADRAVIGLRDRAVLHGPIEDPAMGESWSFRHALLRDVGYASLSRVERARLHVRLARWLEGIAGDRADRLAEVIGGHLEAALAAAPTLAGEVDEGRSRPAVAREAARWLETAAATALRLSATESAIELLRRSLALTDPPDGHDAMRRELMLGETIAAAGDMAAGERHVAHSRDLFRAQFQTADPASEAWLAARDGLSRAAVALSRLVREQLRFDEARLVADETLADIGVDDDLPAARLELAAGTARYFVTDVATDVMPAARHALSVARRDGDRALEVQALETLASDDTTSPSDFLAAWQALGSSALANGRWEQASQALRMQGMAALDLSLDPGPAFDAAFELAVAHGLKEALGWVEYARAETNFALGRWAAAWEVGLRGLELAERGSYHRVAVRTWHVIVPIASAWHRRDVLERAVRWYAEHAAVFPDSGYGRLMRRFVELHFASAGLIASVDHDIASLLPSFDGGLSGATTLEAVGMVVDRWVEAGELQGTREALERMGRGMERSPFPDVPPVWQLLSARLRFAEGDAPGALAHARTALPLFRSRPMPAWAARAIRQLEVIGAATPEEQAEATRIEASLRPAEGLMPQPAPMPGAGPPRTSAR